MGMETPLNASANSAGELFSSTIFEIPEFQREYSWSARGEVTDFWTDLQNGLGNEVYFLGLVILTAAEARKQVVDGQQRIITLSLLAAALYHEAIAKDREALADRISATFLRSINYETDEEEPRVHLSDESDNETFQYIIKHGKTPGDTYFQEDSVSAKIAQSFQLLQKSLRRDLKQDPFKRLGAWADFITNKLYFATFVHPDPAYAYQVYEVINTRGKELTTADLLKNYVLSQTAKGAKQARYKHWQDLAKQFTDEGTNNFVQYIRHAITVEDGHVLPKDLYAFLAGRMRNQDGAPHSPDELMEIFEQFRPIYLQMIDPSAPGPATDPMLGIFGALNSLGVIAVRPILLAIYGQDDPELGMERVLELVVRRIVVGTLGTGNVERRFGDAAQKIWESGDWRPGLADLRDLNPSKEDFVLQVAKRTYNRATLAFLRSSVVEASKTPERGGNLHLICPRQDEDWPGMADDEVRAKWCATLGNAFLSADARRDPEAEDWPSFKKSMLPTGIQGEFQEYLAKFRKWDSSSIETAGQYFAKVAGDVWY